MNPNLEKLFQITQKETRKIIGLMSGTSMDGLDVALCAISGSGRKTKVKVEFFETVPFDENFKQQIRKIFAKETIKFQDLVLLNGYIGDFHGKIVLECLKKWNISSHEIDGIASHGQTVFHAPKHLHKNPNYNHATLQIGDGDALAVRTGILTLSDFRQKHIAAGGEGAPLAAYGDYLIFASQEEDRVLLNMGGIANFTYLPKNTNQIIVTDTGPGNTLLDATMRHFFGQEYDKNAKKAASGTINQELLKELKKHPFFSYSFPKTTGPEEFNLNYFFDCQQKTFTKDSSPEDCLATLTQLSVDTILLALETVVDTPCTFYMSGGGIHNPMIVKGLKEKFSNCEWKLTDDLGILSDAKEAVLFALLANETLVGQPNTFNLSKMPPISMGKISFPN